MEIPLYQNAINYKGQRPSWSMRHTQHAKASCAAAVEQKTSEGRRSGDQSQAVNDMLSCHLTERVSIDFGCLRLILPKM